MIKYGNKTRIFYILVDVILIQFCLYVPYFLKYNNVDALPHVSLPLLKEHVFIYSLWTFFIINGFKQKRLYCTDRQVSFIKEAFMVIRRLAYTGVLIGAIVFVMKLTAFSRHVFILNVLFLAIVLEGWRFCKKLILRKMIKEGFRNINVLIVGTLEPGKELLAEIQRQRHLGLRVIGFLGDTDQKEIEGYPVLGTYEDFEEVIYKYFIDEVIVTVSPRKKSISKLLTLSRKMNLGLRVINESFDRAFPVIDKGFVGMYPVLVYQLRRILPCDSMGKRIFDVIASGSLLLALSPLFLLVSLVIKLTSKGPVFFSQERVGLRGKSFKMYKFRSMVVNAEELKTLLASQNEVKDGTMFKIKNDPRITTIGKFIRKYSIDELPQLWNVIKGDMSLIGPRPPLVEEVESYYIRYIERLAAKPGMTGLPQIRGRSDLSFARWVKWDLWYINNWSMQLDFRIIMWTIPVVIKGRGAY